MDDKREVVIEKRKVRCIDCSRRNRGTGDLCNHIRIDKYKMKPCDDYMPSLSSLANKNKKK